MRTALFNEVSVFNPKSLNRIAALAIAGLASLAFAQPANDACAGAVSIPVVAASTASSAQVAIAGGASGVETPHTCGGSSLTNSVWYTFVAPVSGPYTVSSCSVTTFDSVLQLYSGTCGGVLTPIACNDDDSGACSPRSLVTATLTQGTTYYVQLAAYDAFEVTPGALAGINVTSPSPPPPPPANDTCSTAEVLGVPSGAAVVTSSIARTFSATPAAEEPFSCLTTPTNGNRSVWYSFTPTVTAGYRFESCATSAPGNTISDTVLALYSGTCGTGTLVANAATCNDDGCASRSTVSTTLTAGTTYYLQLARFGAATTVPSLTADSLQLSVSQILNGPSDLCSATSPSLNLNESITVSTSAAADGGFSIAQNNAVLDGGACFTGLGQTTTNLAPGRDVAYQFRVPTAGRYSFRLGSPSASVDGLFYLSDSCVPVVGTQTSSYGPPQCIAASNRNSFASEQLSCVPLTANQTVFVWVDEGALSASGSSAALEVSPCVAEVEGNDTPATANALSCVVTGSTGVANDVDFFALGAHPAGTRVYAMAEAAAANLTDFDMRVTTETRTIEYDNNNLATAFGASAPVIAGAVLTTEPAYLRINYNGATIAEPYVLYSHVQRGPATGETEPNDTFAQASTSSTNHFTGSITDGGVDVDVFSFTANAGELIFAALDSVPDKTDAGTGTFNFVLSLIDSNANVLVTSDDLATATSLTPVNGALTALTPTYPADGLVFRARVSGTYGLRVGKTLGLLPNPYVLSVSVGCADTSPTLNSLVPSAGSPSGGQAVTLTGTNFSSRSVVRFGSSYALVNSISPTQLVVSSPASASSGEVAVSVSNGQGLTATLNPGYTYDDPPGLPPVLTSLSPSVGPITGGTVLTLNGSVFRRDAGVFFDVGGAVVAAASVTFNTAARLTVTTPPQAEGVADVRVVNFDGLSSQLDGGFTFQGPPRVSSITPNTGLIAGGLTITIAGSNLRTGTTVRVGGSLATAVTTAPDGLSLTAVTPAATVNGPVDVVVRTTDAQTSTVTGGFTYTYPAPTLSAVTPGSGYALGGQPITIAGTNFFTGATLTIGGAAATTIVRNTGGTQLTAVTPAGAPGLADVVVTNVDAQSVTRPGGFRYVPAPTLASITPTNGNAQGGTRITITGTGFLSGAVVQMGGVPAFAVDVVSATRITAVTNSGLVGPNELRVINPDLQFATLAAAFTSDGAPLLTSLSPISGTTAGGTSVTLTGAGFLAGATVIFGTTAATSVTLNSPTELVAVTPVRPVGVVSVTVTNADNQSAVLARAYRFVAPPTVSAVAPSSGDVAGNTLVRVTGTGFTANTRVSFGGTQAQQVSLVSGTEVDAVSPPHAPGAVDLVVDTEGAIATLTGAFTYTRGPPTLAVVAPATGPITGATLMTLQGTGFAPGATVTIGGSPATDVVIVSSLLARVVTPAHAAGVVDVVLTNDDRQAATLVGGFTYTAPTGAESGVITDGGSGALGTNPVIPGDGQGGVSCGCSGFDGSMFSLGGLGVLMALSRRRRRS